MGHRIKSLNSLFLALPAFLLYKWAFSPEPSFSSACQDLGVLIFCEKESPFLFRPLLPPLCLGEIFFWHQELDLAGIYEEMLRETLQVLKNLA